MRKVYYDQDATMVQYYAEVLEGEGIRVMVKNIATQLAAGEVPFQLVFPEVWVMDDEDYERAVGIVRDLRDGAGEVDFSGIDFEEEGVERGDVGGKPGMFQVMMWFAVVGCLVFFAIWLSAYVSEWGN